MKNTIKRIAIIIMSLIAEGAITITGLLAAFYYANAYMIHGFVYERIVVGYWVILIGLISIGTVTNVNFTLMGIKNNTKQKDKDPA